MFASLCFAEKSVLFDAFVYAVMEHPSPIS